MRLLRTPLAIALMICVIGLMGTTAATVRMADPPPPPHVRAVNPAPDPEPAPPRKPFAISFVDDWPEPAHVTISPHAGPGGGTALYQPPGSGYVAPVPHSAIYPFDVEPPGIVPTRGAASIT